MKVIKITYQGEPLYVGHTIGGDPPTDPKYARKFASPADAACLIAAWPGKWAEMFHPEIVDFFDEETHAVQRNT